MPLGGERNVRLWSSRGSIVGLFGAARDSAALSASHASELWIGCKAAGATILTALGANLGVEVRVFRDVFLRSLQATSFCSIGLLLIYIFTRGTLPV